MEVAHTRTGPCCYITRNELAAMMLLGNSCYVMFLGKNSVGAKITMHPLQLPDNIQQRLLDGQYTRATYALMERYAIPIDQAWLLLTRWLDET